MNKKDNAISPYELESLSPENQKLINNICFHVSSKVDKKIYELDNKGLFVFPWDGSVFQEFVTPTEEFLKEFKSQLRKNEIKGVAVNYDGNFKRMHNDRIGEKAALKAFCVSAKIHGRSLKEHLKSYLHSRDGKAYQIKGFDGHKETIDNLKSEPFVVKTMGENELQVGSKSVGDPFQEREYILSIYASKPLQPYIGDAIEITKINPGKIYASVKTPFDRGIHVFEGKFSVTNNNDIFKSWVQGYSDNVKGYIEKNIEDQSRQKVTEGAKVGVGFIAYNHDAAASGVSIPLVIQPLNHLITAAFNRKIAQERIKYNALSEAHQIWNIAFSTALHKSVHGFEFDCSSQFFVEFAVITSDGFVPITKKKTEVSVYALRNNGKRLYTCGFERGPNWNDVIIEEKNKKAVEINLFKSVLNGLKGEFSMPDWDMKKDDIHLMPVSYVVQTLHLNTAILGYCKIPYTKSQLFNELYGKEVGGLDHSNLKFVELVECQHLVDKYSRSTEWHGTAVMRLKIIADNIQKIRAIL